TSDRPTAPLYVSFFLLTRPPLIPTLFPYTTLFRSISGSRPPEALSTRTSTRSVQPRSSLMSRAVASGSVMSLAIAMTRRPVSERSEEHTSELQSLTNLVCRLLLEKKKQRDEVAVHA